MLIKINIQYRMTLTEPHTSIIRNAINLLGRVLVSSKSWTNETPVELTIEQIELFH